MREPNPLNTYRTSAEQALDRPFFEPPDIEVVGIYDKPGVAKSMKDIHTEIPDPSIRAQFLDLLGELWALEEYLSWADDVCEEISDVEYDHWDEEIDTSPLSGHRWEGDMTGADDHFRRSLLAKSICGAWVTIAPVVCSET